MTFCSDIFAFNGVSSEEFGLMMYEIDSSSSETTSTLSVSAEIIEDRLPRQYRPLHYGTTVNTPLEFDMTFGADVNAIEAGRHYDRYEMEAIASWLTSHDGYRWLEIMQPDMEPFRYRCFITKLQHVDFNGSPLAFKCTVVCDSPFAYRYPKTYKYNVDGTLDVRIFNESSYPGYYKPDIRITPSSGGTFSIQNLSDNGRITQFTGLPANTSSVYVDGVNEVIKCDEITNPYSYFNFNFLRMPRKENRLRLSGKGIIEIICEFPVSIGG